MIYELYVFLDKLFLNISSFLLIEEETHASMTFYAGLHINYFPVMFIFIIIADIIANAFFRLVNKILLTAKWKEEKLITLK